LPEVRKWHLERKSVRPVHLAVQWALIVPGATVAGTSIRLPDYAKPASKLIDALILKCSTGSSTHAACAATGAAYPSATDLLSPSGEALVVEAKKLTVVTKTPTTGQIQLVDPSNVVLGEGTSADDILIVIVELKP